MITEKAYQVLNNVTPIVQKCIHAINIYYSDYITIFSNPVPSVKIPQRIFFLVNLFGINPHMNTKMTIMTPLDCCFNNIHLELFTKFIIHPLLMNGDLTCTIHLRKIITPWLFTYLLKIENDLKA